MQANIKDLYNIKEWGENFFDISKKGNLLVQPHGNEKLGSIDLLELVEKLIKEGLRLPILVRFTDILRCRFDTLHQAFANAIQGSEYKGKFTSVYPIKVNQQRRVVEQVLKSDGYAVGLEAGSKPELMAALALSIVPGSTILCNGYKDRDYIRLALIGQKMGHEVFIILEKFSELKIILAEAKKIGVRPRLGVRVRLASTGAGKWQDTGGEKSKFGFSAASLLSTVELLKETDHLDTLNLLHFHLGSQIANIRDIQRAMRECARYYGELRQLGANIQTVDVGGGLAIDYDGTHTRSFCSMNYSMQEYANNVVYTFSDFCNEMNLPHPQIVTESGRAMTAHHAVLITNVIDVEEIEEDTSIVPPSAEEPQIIHDFWQGYITLSERSALEAYHDACHWMEEAVSLYTHGILNLTERAKAEKLYHATCKKARDLLRPNIRAHQEILDELNEKLADKLFCNFSLFQSLPDAWAIQQIFPIVPICDLNKPPARRAKLQDLTCDSDGRINFYVNHEGIEKTLPLPMYSKDNPHLLGIFLVGAYQESLGDIHNLFGDVDSIHVSMLPDGGYDLLEPVKGDQVEAVLSYVQFKKPALLGSYKKQLSNASLTKEEQEKYMEELIKGLESYTYLEH